MENAVESQNPTTFVHVTVPSKIGQDRSAVRTYAVDPEKPRRAEITLPAHAGITMADGTKKDVSFYKLQLNESAVKQFINDQGYLSLSFPAANKEGNPWMIRLSQSQGHWENPEATGEERGRWIEDLRETVSVPVEQFKQDMEALREQRREYAKSLDPKEQDKVKTTDLKERTNEAKAASQARAKEAETPTQAVEKAAKSASTQKSAK